MSKDISETDDFIFNDKFTSKLIKVRLTLKPQTQNLKPRKPGTQKPRNPRTPNPKP